MHSYISEKRKRVAGETEREAKKSKSEVFDAAGDDDLSAISQGWLDVVTTGLPCTGHTSSQDVATALYDQQNPQGAPIAGGSGIARVQAPVEKAEKVEDVVEILSQCSLVESSQVSRNGTESSPSEWESDGEGDRAVLFSQLENTEVEKRES